MPPGSLCNPDLDPSCLDNSVCTDVGCQHVCRCEPGYAFSVDESTTECSGYCAPSKKLLYINLFT